MNLTINATANYISNLSSTHLSLQEMVGSLYRDSYNLMVMVSVHVLLFDPVREKDPLNGSRNLIGVPSSLNVQGDCFADHQMTCNFLIKIHQDRRTVYKKEKIIYENNELELKKINLVQSKKIPKIQIIFYFYIKNFKKIYKFNLIWT